VAQEEVLRGVIDFEIVPITSDDNLPAEDEIFIGEELGSMGMEAKDADAEIPQPAVDPKPAKETPPKAKKTKSPPKD